MFVDKTSSCHTVCWELFSQPYIGLRLSTGTHRRLFKVLWVGMRRNIVGVPSKIPLQNESNFDHGQDDSLLFPVPMYCNFCIYVYCQTVNLLEILY